MPAQIIGPQATAVQLYVAFNGVAPSNPIYTSYLSNIQSTSTTAFADALGDTFASVSDSALASTVLNNLGISAATTNQTAFDALSAAVAQLFAAYPGQRGIVVLNMINILSTLEGNATYGTAAAAWNNVTLNAFVYSSNTANVSPGPIDTVPPGGVFNLTTGADNIVGTSGNDTINAIEVPAGAVWTVGDKVDGGAGTDTFNVTQTAAVSTPLSATVANVETANLVSGTSGSSLNTTSWTGLLSLNLVAPGAVTVTGAATTAIAVTDAVLGASAVTVNGGSTVDVTTTSAGTGSTIAVGGTTAAAGAVTVNTTTSMTDGGGATVATGTAVTVTGGTTITVNNVLSSAASNDVGDALTGGAVVVTGDANTTTVSVTQTAASARSATGAGKAAIIDGVVTVADKNAADATKASTITTVTLNNYGGAGVTPSSINSGALTTVNLSGTSGTLTVTAGGLTTPVVSTLALNVNELSVAPSLASNAITLDSDYKTLNVDGTGKASTIANVTAAGVTALNVSGDAKVTLTDNTFAALTSVVSTNTAGLVLGTTAIKAGVSFTGGDGADSVILTGGFTKAIVMGAGNDTVTYGGAAGTGGSVAAGDGTDTIIMTNAQAAAADDNSTFNSKFTGFEVLQLSDALAAGTTLNLGGLNNVSQVTLAAGGADAATSVITNMQDNGTLKLTADSTGVVVELDNALFNANDTFNINLSKTTALAAGSVTAAGVENVNIAVNDASTSSSGSAAVVHALTLVAANAKNVTVSGNNGLNLTGSTLTAVTNFDASGVTANGTADTAANLAVTFTSGNNGATAAVTITGGAGNDILTGGGAKDTITGGAGADIVTGGLNQDTLALGSGRDVARFSSDSDADFLYADSTTGAADVVTGFGLVQTAVTAADFSSAAAFQASAAGGANLNLLSIDLAQDNGGAGFANLAVAIEANGTGNGQAAGVTYTVTSGILTLAGAGAATVDTLGEWLVEAAAVAATAGEVLAFSFGADTYVFAQNGAQDELVQLVGVAASSVVLASGATTAAAGALIIGDTL